MALRLPKQSHVVLTPDRRVFIDGHEVFGVTEVRSNHDQIDGTTVEITLRPGSVVYGDPPTETIAHLHEQGLSEPGETVDINKAIERAEKRKKEHP